MDELDRKLGDLIDAFGGAVDELRTAIEPTSDRVTRLECLRLAVGQGADCGNAGLIVQRARSYADFVLGTSDAEIIGAARELADKVRDHG